MKVSIQDGCIACGLCGDTCPTVFRIGDAGVAEVLAQPASSDESAAQEAADSCPVSVILTEN